MNFRHLGAFLLIGAFLCLVDWILGAACVAGLPKIAFLLANFPFGAVYIWFESHWTGTGYVISGRPVSEVWSLAAFLGTVLPQAGVYWGSWVLWDRRRQRHYRRKRGLCVRCGYNLTGNLSGICPECGERI